MYHTLKRTCYSMIFSLFFASFLQKTAWIPYELFDLLSSYSLLSLVAQFSRFQASEFSQISTNSGHLDIVLNSFGTNFSWNGNWLTTVPVHLVAVTFVYTETCANLSASISSFQVAPVYPLLWNLLALLLADLYHNQAFLSSSWKATNFFSGPIFLHSDPISSYMCRSM